MSKHVRQYIGIFAALAVYYVVHEGAHLIAALIVAYALTFLREPVCRSKSKVFRASAYYVTIALLTLDPLYLSLLCGIFGGGDMNGIKLLVPEPAARITAGLIFIRPVR